MKRIASILLLLCMVFALGACNKEEKPAISIDEMSLADYLDAWAHTGRCNWNEYSSDEQMGISQKAKDSQVTLIVSDSGVIKIVDISGIIIEYGGSWPNESVIEDLPAPNNKVAYSRTLSGTMCQVALYASMDDAKAYAKTLADSGYTANVIEEEGEGTYWYSGENEAGQTGAIVFEQLEKGIMIISVSPSSMQ